jgi:hypothetical protein
MKIPTLLLWRTRVFVLMFGPLTLHTALAQQPTSAAPTLLSQMAAAFTAGQQVQKVQLVGSVVWHAGGSEDSGTASLAVGADGSSTIQFALSNAGTRTEAQTGLGFNATCSWSGSDGVSHTISPKSCWRPAVWFLPDFSLQPSLLPGYLNVADVGSGTVGSGASVYRHLQNQILLSGAAAGTIASDLAQQTTTDIGIDPNTYLPAVLTYSVRPDNPSFPPIAFEVHYSDYRALNGVQIPFRIQRYLNGALELDITVESAQAN